MSNQENALCLFMQLIGASVWVLPPFIAKETFAKSVVWGRQKLRLSSFTFGAALNLGATDGILHLWMFMRLSLALLPVSFALQILLQIDF